MAHSDLVAIPGESRMFWRPMAKAAEIRSRLRIPRDELGETMRCSGVHLRNLETGAVPGSGQNDIDAYCEALEDAIGRRIRTLRKALDELEDSR